MLGRSHAVLGAVAGSITGQAADITTPPGIVACAILGGLAGLAPDLDHPNSLLGRHLPGWWHKLTPGHRGMTHSLAWAVAVGGLVGVLAARLGIHRHTLVGLVVTLGIVTHLAGDGLTRQGVPWIWPLTKRRFALPVAIKTGGAAENLLVANFAAAGIVYPPPTSAPPPPWSAPHWPRPASR